MVLGNCFPENIRNNYINQHPQISNVYKYHNEIADKIKLILIVAEYKSHLFAYCFINTDINPTKYPVDSLYIQFHKKIFVVNNSYLDHDSYVNCNEIYEVEKSRVNKALQDDIGAHLGCMNKSDFKDIIQKIIDNPSILRKIKKKYNFC